MKYDGYYRFIQISSFQSIFSLLLVDRLFLHFFPIPSYKMHIFCKKKKKLFSNNNYRVK